MKKAEKEKIIIESRIKGLSYIKIGAELGMHPDKVKYICQKIGVNGAFVKELRLARMQAREEEKKSGWIK